MKHLLNDDVVALRALEPTDLDLLYVWENDTSLWTIGNSITPFSRALLWEYLQNNDGDVYKQKQIRLMIDAHGASVGTIDLYDFDPFNNRIAIGVLIDSQWRGKGLGERAVNLAVNYCVQFLGVNTLWAIIPVDNTVSHRLFEKCGFTLSATLKQWLRRGGKYVDAHIFQVFSSR